MKLKINMKIAQSVLLGLIAIMLAGLLFWYFYLRSQENAAQVISGGRGFGSAAPQFTGTVGSTETNGGFGSAQPSVNTGSTSAPPHLWKVSALPVAGATFLTAASSSPSVRFVDRSTGHVLEVNLQTGKVLRLTNTLIPHVYKALFGAKGAIILQTLDETDALQTFAGTIKTATSTTGEGSLSGNYLNRAIREITFSPAGDRLFYIESNVGGAYGVTAEVDGSKPKRIFTSGIVGWQVSWPSINKIVLAQNASDGLSGSALALDTSGNRSSLEENVSGLTVTSANSSAFIFGFSSSGTLSLFATAAPDKTPVSIALKTIADKCVFGPSSSSAAYCAVPLSPTGAHFLDNWYRGTTDTSDAIYFVNTITGGSELVISPESEYGAALDGYNLFVSGDGNYLGFMNKRDNSLWILRIHP